MAALICFAGELELQRIFQDLVGPERKVVCWHQHLRELLYKAVDSRVEGIGHGHELVVRLAMPETVLEAEKALEVRAVYPADEAEGAAIDLVVEIPEGVVGGPQAGVIEVGREPELTGVSEAAGIDCTLQRVRCDPKARHPMGEARPVIERRELDLVRGNRYIRVYACNRWAAHPLHARGRG